jgi:hypothetical protein
VSRVGVAIGDQVLDLSAIASAGLFSFDASFFAEVQNIFLSLVLDLTESTVHFEFFHGCWEGDLGFCACADHDFALS